jgi:hypothetical protein
MEPGERGSDIEPDPKQDSGNHQTDGHREFANANVESADWFVMKHQAQKVHRTSRHDQ